MKKPSDNTGKIARSSTLVSIAVMCSRILGLVREQVFATFFGAGYAYDAFVVAFRIPNLLRDLFGEGALSAAFITVFTDYYTNKGEKETWRLANNVLVAVGCLLSCITMGGIFFADSIISLMSPGYGDVAGKFELTRLLTVTMFPFLIFVSLAAVVMGMLNTRGKFFIPSMSSAFFNLGSIVGGLGLSFIMPRFGQPAILGMALGTLIGGALQFSGQLPFLFRVGFKFRPRLDLSDPGLKRIFLLMLPAVVGLGATQINIFVNTNFASSCAEGSVSWLNYAFRLVQFPIGIFGVALSIGTMPVIAKCAAVKDMAGVRETYTSSLIMAFCLTIPASVGLYLLSVPIIRVIFEHGVFSSFDTLRTAEALSFYVLGLFAYSCVKITAPVFYALDDSKVPVIGSFLAVGVNVLMVLLTIEAFQHKAIAFSVSCAMTGNFLFLSVVLYRKIHGYPLGYLALGLLKVMAASLVMAGWLLFARNLLSDWMMEGVLYDICGLGVLVVSGALLYGVSLYFLGLKEMKFLVEKMVGKVKGGRG